MNREQRRQQKIQKNLDRVKSEEHWYRVASHQVATFFLGAIHLVSDSKRSSLPSQGAYKAKRQRGAQ